MNFKVVFYIFFIAGIVALLVGILAKLFAFEIFTLRPLSYLRFAGVCGVYSITSLLAQNLCKKE